jgi:hypothetical protein
MQAVEEVEQQCHADDEHEHANAHLASCHGAQTCSTTMPSMTSTTSSQRATTASTKS